MFASIIQNNFLCYGKIAISNPSLKWDDYWITVRDYWVEISKKVGQPVQFCIPLDLITLSSGFEQTGLQNSIFIETSNLIGSFSFFISTTNRLDIIQLFQSLEKGRKILNDAISKRQIEKITRFDIESSGFLGMRKEKFQFEINPQGIDINGSKKSHFDLEFVLSVTAKQNDSNCHTKLILIIEEGGNNIQKEFNCLDHSSLLNAISCFIFNKKNNK